LIFWQHSAGACALLTYVNIDDIAMALKKMFDKLECGPMPNVMAAQPNIGGAVYESSVIPFLVPRPTFG